MNQKLTLTGAMFSPRDYIKWWMTRNNHTSRGVKNSETALYTLYLDYDRDRQVVAARTAKTKLPKFSNTMLECAFLEFVTLGLKHELETAMDAYKCGSENLAPLHAWMKAVTGFEGANDIAVISHWCWMVKRKAYNLPVKHQIMPVIFGKQGGGKTQAIEKLIKPIETYRLAIGMHQLSDDRVFDGLANNFVVVFDELQGVARLDMDVLKKQITATHNTYRKLHTHIVINAPMRASFIGASNKPVSHSFNDNTGMRRFWELKAIDTLDWKAVNAIDYTELWTGIDENREDGYLEGDALKQVLESQQVLVNKENVEEFADEHLLLAPAGGETTKISSNQLYQDYCLWAGKYGVNKRLDKGWFTKKLGLIVPMLEEKDAKGVKQKIFFISTNALITNTLTTGGTQ